MPAMSMFNVHRTWEDGLCIVAGLAICASPWMVEGAASQPAVLNALAVGLVIAAVAAMQLSALQRWEEWVQLVLGLWLIAAPWALGYTHFGSLTMTHVVLGAVVAILAAYELWQDWALSDQELAHHGR
jgi:SPW repeat